MIDNDWYYEDQTDNQRIGFRIKKTLYSGKSKFQKIDVYDTVEHGKLLTLDDLIMVSERFEFVYHEMITHIPLCSHPNPRKVLVIGGGDGGTVREVLKHKEIEKVALCEIDGEVIEKSKEFLPFTAKELDNPKVEVVVQDGFKYLKENENTYDVILVDSTEPIGESAKLFDKSFYELCRDSLQKDGILAFQSESPFNNGEFIKEIYNEKLKKTFDITKLYLASIPDYPMGLWSFGFGSKRYHPEGDFIKSRAVEISKSTKYYNEDIHKSCFALPNFVKKLTQ